MHQSQEYIRSHCIIGTPGAQAVQNTAITEIHARKIKSKLSSDALSYFYSSSISFAEAIRGLEQQSYSWSTVKLYYSVFYAFRSILASKNRCIFYVGKTPYSLHSRTGSYPKKGKGNTHGAILDLFSKELSNHILLSQEIELEKPAIWLSQKRNQANYTDARFGEPAVPSHLSNITTNGTRKNLAHYESDTSHLFTFDEDHSMVSFPFQALREARKLIKNENEFDLDIETISYLRSLAKDKKGVIPSFSRLIQG
jgi:hypothetical protein